MVGSATVGRLDARQAAGLEERREEALGFFVMATETIQPTVASAATQAVARTAKRPSRPQGDDAEADVDDQSDDLGQQPGRSSRA